MRNGYFTNCFHWIFDLFLLIFLIFITSTKFECLLVYIKVKWLLFIILIIISQPLKFSTFKKTNPDFCVKPMTKWCCTPRRTKKMCAKWRWIFGGCALYHITLAWEPYEIHREIQILLYSDWCSHMNDAVIRIDNLGLYIRAAFTTDR